MVRMTGLYGSDVGVVGVAASLGGSAYAHSSNSLREQSHPSGLHRLRRLYAACFVSDVHLHVDFALARSFEDFVYWLDASKLLQGSRQETL